jgi:hypothetical protein
MPRLPPSCVDGTALASSCGARLIHQFTVLGRALRSGRVWLTIAPSRRRPYLAPNHHLYTLRMATSRWRTPPTPPRLLLKLARPVGCQMTPRLMGRFHIRSHHILETPSLQGKILFHGSCVKRPCTRSNCLVSTTIMLRARYKFYPIRATLPLMNFSKPSRIPPLSASPLNQKKSRRSTLAPRMKQPLNPSSTAQDNVLRTRLLHTRLP